MTPPIDPKLISPTGQRIQPAQVATVAKLLTASELSAQIAADERELAGLRRDVQMRIIEGITA